MSSFASPHTRRIRSRPHSFAACSGLLGLLPWLVKGGPALLRSRNSGFFLARAGIGIVSMATWFYGITVVPLATATVYRTAVATLAAALVLHVNVRLHRGARYHASSSERLGASLLILLLSAAMNKRSSSWRAPSRRAEALLTVYLVVAEWPDPSTFGALVALGCLGTIAHLPVARARGVPAPARVRLSDSPDCPSRRLSVFSGSAKTPTGGPGWPRSSPEHRSTWLIVRRVGERATDALSRRCPDRLGEAASAVRGFLMAKSRAPS